MGNTLFYSARRTLTHIKVSLESKRAAAPDHVPSALVQQLKPGGRMVIPVGDLTQDLMVITKKPDGTTTSTTVVPVRFVPLIRK